MVTAKARSKDTVAVDTAAKPITASARFIRYSPYKLRPIVDVIRGKSVQSHAINHDGRAVVTLEEVTQLGIDEELRIGVRP